MGNALLNHKKYVYFFKPSSSTMSSTGASSTFTAGEPKVPNIAETNQFYTLENNDPALSNKPSIGVEQR